MSEASVTLEKMNLAEQQIRQEQKQINYTTREYPIEVLVDKYLTGIDDNSNELFIPDPHKGMRWDEEHQSNFIEFIFLGFSITGIYVSEVWSENDQDDRKLEMIDGSQRLQTLARFVNNQLTLCNLSKLTQLNGVQFASLSNALQRKFRRRSVRVVQFNPDTTEEDRRDFFERFNS
ncbi:DUF262 domain-containing protein [Laspinema palackyanum]|uniref:DUF262 domain-containing protein n=1 Tax=Laspinema palackyanum TaxID=3231601 RepID=UPI00345D3CF4|nr:DUF262 domain-containing protein [Laspinema sp. D2c]